jgi:hypothetical protein
VRPLVRSGQPAHPRADQADDVPPEVDEGRRDRAQLDDRRVCRDRLVRDIQPEELLRHREVPGRRHRQELGETLDDAEDEGLEIAEV